MEKRQTFFSDFAKTRSATSSNKIDEQKWERFFADMAAFRQSFAHASPPPLLGEADIERSRKFYADFDRLWSLFLSSGNGVDVVNLLDLDRKELRYGKILAWLLDCRGDHGQKVAFLRSIVSQDFAIKPHYSTRVEQSFDDARVDIEVEGPDFLFIFELKIEADEHGDQLRRYLKNGEMRKGSRDFGLFFVTPDGSPPREIDLRGKVKCLSWKSIGKAVSDIAQGMKDSHGKIVIRQLGSAFEQIRLGN
jgi:hypothetical protein